MPVVMTLLYISAKYKLKLFCWWLAVWTWRWPVTRCRYQNDAEQSQTTSQDSNRVWRTYSIVIELVWILFVVSLELCDNDSMMITIITELLLI